MSQPKPIYTRLCDAPEVFGPSETTLRRWRDQGHIKFHKRGRMVFLRTEAVTAYIEGLGGYLGDHAAIK